MYIRNVKQLLRQTEPGFDERRYGFANLVDLLRAAQREGIVRLERDRQGALRVFQGTQWTQAIDGLPLEDPALEALDVPEGTRDTVLSGVAAAEEPDVLLEDGSRETLPPHGEPLAEPASEKPKRGRGRGRGTRNQGKPEAAAQPAKPARARKTARTPRAAKPAAATTTAPRRRTSRKAAATQEPAE
jgi:hypothetical protein